MKYLDEFRNGELAHRLITKIRELAGDREIVLMEVCGTHTMAIFRYGLRTLLPPSIRLVSGPGCPVCVTPNSYLDQAIAYVREKNIILTTFGDMMRVPGSSSSLEKEKAKGHDVRMVYSTLGALKIAKDNPRKKVVFLGVGFETTSPTVAASLIKAEKEKINNYLVLCAHKLIPPAMEALVNTAELHIDGFICPGHVSAIIGAEPYKPIAGDHHIPCVIAGFEPLDILQAIHMLISQIGEGKTEVGIQYRRAVRKEGNPRALSLLEEMFEVEDTSWRGLGTIPASGLKMRNKCGWLDAQMVLDIEAEETRENPNCICGDILRGIKTSEDCPLFKTACRPENPLGACMVSSEGTCAAYYKYGET
ncbi:hydrogenase formation protein HypD [candidate division NPL-UPA2 bacterium]|nr:hydrogenase formation protein HypD [candidate division NPL-UPA2 bacterium]